MTEEERAEVEAAIGYRFAEASRLERALTHRSRRQEGPVADNEQLEFLGDALLGLVVGQHLVAGFPDWSEGQLSKGRARLVNAHSLEQAGRRLDLGRRLRLGPGEDKTGGREKRKLVADAYEALAGAIYLDGGLEQAAAFVRRSLIDPAAPGWLTAEDAKSSLQEWLQKRGLGPARYRVVREAGPDHAKRFHVEVTLDERVLASGEGTSKKEAEQQAAGLALARLEKEAQGAPGECETERGGKADE
jgi:ribonuclease III